MRRAILVSIVLLFAAVPVLAIDYGKIAFVSQRDLNPEIYTMNSDGTNQNNLTNNFNANDEFPAFSPDGNKIVFRSDRFFTPGICVMNADDGTELTCLTGGPNGFNDTTPAYSPDGATIVFTREIYPNGPTIYAMNADGSRVRQLTRVSQGGDF